MIASARVHVFIGPTLPLADARRVLDATYLPPAAQGDVYAAARAGARIIGIVDGVFEAVPSVWHKEILWALSRGVHVFGSASMGALRAAETDAFGTVGVGAIYRAYRSGAIADDDEVAVVHGPGDTGYRLMSEAMVNIRATIRAAVGRRILSMRSGRAIEALAKSLYYPDRSWETLLRDARSVDVTPSEVERLRRWLPRGRIDQKRSDALRMLRRIRLLAAGTVKPFRPRFEFESTFYWRRVVRDVRVARS